MRERCVRCGEEYTVGVVGKSLRDRHMCPLGSDPLVASEHPLAGQVDQIDGEIPFHSIPSGGDILRFDRAQQEDSED